MTAILVGGNINAFAGGNIDIAKPASGSGYEWDSPTLTITSNGDYTFTGATTANRIAVNPNLTAVSITLENVTIKSSNSCAFSIGSESTVYLTLKGIDTLESGSSYAGLQAPSGAKLFIDGPGALNVTGGSSGGAGIGSSRASSVGGSSGHITINSGTVTAKGGGSYGAGIGGGNNDKGIITINGGTVVATSRSNGAGIGGGSGSGGTIIITNGEVTATSTSGAGIGSGSLSYNSNGIVTITGGTVMATSYDGAGIGGGSNSSGTIVIDSGTVTATSAKGAGIGGGGSSSGTIVINNGTVTATSSEGAGIGGGTGGSGSITINGGTVDATSDDGAGIGTGSLGSGSNDGNVTIKGGMVTAKSNSNGAGIGCGFSNPTTCKITIAGGIVDATSEFGAGVGSDELGNNISEITISGGSIDASSAYNAGIGNNNDPAQSTVRIDGGSVKASGRGSAVSPQPENSNNTPVYLNELTLGYSPVKNTPVAKGSIDDVPCDTLPAAATGVYGIKDVETDDASKLYFWLPETSTPQIISVTANDTTYDNMFSRNADNSNADTLYKAPAVITSVTHIGGQDTSGMILATFSRPMPTGSTGDTVMLVCRECLTSEIVLPPSTGAWSGNRLYKIPFSGLEYSSTYRVYVMGFRDTIGRTVEKDTAHTITTKLMQSITPAAYNTESPYVVGDTIIAEKGEYTANNGGDEGSHSYQWYRSDDGVSAGNPISGANDSIYIPSDEDFGKYIYIATTPVGSEGHKVRPVSSDKIRIGVKITAGVKGGHGGAALFSNGKSDTVAYDDTRMELFLRKNFAADTLLGWSDCYADGDTAWGIFSISPDTSYAVPGKPKGDITLTATLGLPAPKLTFPVASSITYGDMLKQSVLTGGTCSCKGSFAWVAGDTTLRAGVHSLPVAFTPNDQDYDYSSLSGWNESSGTVRRPVEVTVNKKEISIAGGSVEKTYDGDVSATVDSLLFYGLVAGDTLRPGRDYSVNDAKFDTPDAGSGDKTVTLTAELLPSDLASNYTLTNGTDYPLTGQSIDKISPTTDLLEYTLSDTTYDGKQKPVAVEAGSNVEGLGSITVFYNGEATPPVNAGDYTVSVKIEGGANYSHDSLTLGTFTISKADPTIDLLSYAPGDFDVTYDGAPQLVDVEKQNGVEGLGDVTTLYNGNTTPPVNAGTYAVTVKIENGENYNDATFTLGDLAIQKAEPTTDLLEYTPKEVTYNGAPQPVSVKELDELGSITVFYNGEATPPVNAGDYTVSVKIGGGANYSHDSLTLGTFTISKADPTTDLLSYAPEDFDVTYNGAPQRISVDKLESVEGLDKKITVFYNGDTTPPVNAGDYLVTVHVEGGDNYNEATLPLGTLTISKADPTIDLLSYAPEDFTVTYNGTPQPVSVEKQSSVEGLGSITVFYNGEATPPVNAGNYPITVKIEEGDNYNAITLTLENPLTISKAQLTPDDLQFSPIRVTYDDTPHGVTVTPSFPCPEPCRSIGNITVTYNGDERKPVDTGKYAVAVTVAEGDNYKSVTIPMELGIFQIRSATILYDSICINEAYANNGFVLPVQLESGWFTHADTIREELYDSIVQLKLKVCEQIRFSVKNASACADDTKVEVEYELEPGSGIPSYYSATFDKAQNFFTTDVEDALPAAIPMPDNVRPDIYSGALRLSNDKCISEAQPFSITVNYPSSVMKQKWSNVIAIYKGKYEFSAFQWLKNDVEVPGATLPYLYTPPMLDFTATYSVRLTRADDGVTLPACPCKVSPQAQEEKEENIAAYPTITSKGGALTVISLQQGEAITRNTFGNEVSRQKFNAGMSSIVAPGQTGMYFVELYATGKKSRIVKILVK